MTLKEWQDKNREKVRAYNRKYYWKNREEISVQRKEKRKANPQKYRDYSKKSYEKNTIGINEKRRVQWKKVGNSVKARRREKFKEDGKYIVHIVQNGKTKRVRLNRKKSETCDICHRKVNRRNAHHYSYENLATDWITVCTGCHVLIHMGIWHNKYYGIFDSIDDWYKSYRGAIEKVQGGNDG